MTSTWPGTTFTSLSLSLCVRSDFSLTWSMLGLSGSLTSTRVLRGLQSGSWLQILCLVSSLQVGLVELDWEEGRDTEVSSEGRVSSRA